MARFNCEKAKGGKASSCFFFSAVWRGWLAGEVRIRKTFECSNLAVASRNHNRVVLDHSPVPPPDTRCQPRESKIPAAVARL